MSATPFESSMLIAHSGLFDLNGEIEKSGSEEASCQSWASGKRSMERWNGSLLKLND